MLLVMFFLISVGSAAMMSADPCSRLSRERQRSARLSLLALVGALLSSAATRLPNTVWVVIPVQIALCLTTVSCPLFYLFAMGSWFAEFRPSPKEAEQMDQVGLTRVR